MHTHRERSGHGVGCRHLAPQNQELCDSGGLGYAMDYRPNMEVAGAPLWGLARWTQVAEVEHEQANCLIGNALLQSHGPFREPPAWRTFPWLPLVLFGSSPKVTTAQLAT